MQYKQEHVRNRRRLSLLSTLSSMFSSTDGERQKQRAENQQVMLRWKCEQQKNINSITVQVTLCFLIWIISGIWRLLSSEFILFLALLRTRCHAQIVCLTGTAVRVVAFLAGTFSSCTRAEESTPHVLSILITQAWRNSFAAMADTLSLFIYFFYLLVKEWRPRFGWKNWVKDADQITTFLFWVFHMHTHRHTTASCS